MSQITIQYRLVASESTRRQLWELMTGKNTPLVNELLALVSQHPDFEPKDIKRLLRSHKNTKLVALPYRN
jgi:hypothetical protein